MPDENIKSTFNVSGNMEGNISMAGRDSHQVVTQSSAEMAAISTELEKMRTSLEGLNVSPPLKRVAGSALEGAAREAASPRPDTGVLSRRLEEFVEIAKVSGILATAGTALSGPLQKIASALGSAGSALLSMLP